MSRQKVFSASEAARLIPDGAIVTVSSSSALGCPDSVLKAIGERFEAEGRPRNITTLRPIAAGDMWGARALTISPSPAVWPAFWPAPIRRVLPPPGLPRSGK
jgi:propionate CoA-transferase